MTGKTDASTRAGGMLYVYARCALCSHHWKVRGALQITDVVLEDIDNPVIQTRS